MSQEPKAKGLRGSGSGMREAREKRCDTVDVALENMQKAQQVSNSPTNSKLLQMMVYYSINYQALTIDTIVGAIDHVLWFKLQVNYVLLKR